MPRLPPLKNRDRLVKALMSLGYEVSTKSGKGVHYKLKMNGGSLTVPQHLESTDTRQKFEKRFIALGGNVDALMEKL